MKRERWHKKEVTLTWNTRKTSFAVAQELFSSHEVDAGSRLLLRSIEVANLPEHGHAFDFGSGYGVLGLALRDALPGWTVQLVDRDALAVAFSQWNVERLEFANGSVRSGVGLGLDSAPEPGCDLILWNVPGKAGEPVLDELTHDVARALADGGLAALVVVNPLAKVIRDGLRADEAITVVHDEEHAEHTIIHARRVGAGTRPTDPFERGVFDREIGQFGVDDFDYDITPVVGLPEYDTYGFATQVVFDALQTIEGNVNSMLIMRPGQGHVPLVAANRLHPQRLAMIDRDQLALRASVRALVDAGLRVPKIEMVASPDLIEVPIGDGFSLAILMLEDQVRNEIHIARLGDLATLIEPGGNIIVGGTSSVVSRFLSFAAKTNAWKVRDRIKRSGASAARLEAFPAGRANH
ncbi:MAG: class I SAM-dependent methyltransferase [Chloroflexota bacterium]|nr:class I SAM-dependent methyltransferase [Chloroflexota bacterium]